MILDQKVIEDIREHARDDFPKESCGIICDGEYIRCFNYALNPEKDFVISDKEIARHVIDGKLEAIVHSHPNGPHYPSDTDMISQVETDVPWIIVPIDEERSYDLIVWGGEPAPIIGRKFIHGVNDCYSLIRDVYRLGKTELKKQDVEWPFDPVELPEFPRRDCWWLKDGDVEAQDMYIDGFKKAGFREVSFETVKPGDVFLIDIRSDKLNHGGLLLKNQLILHHLPSRLSRRESAGAWCRAAKKWLRHEVSKDA